MHNTTKHKIFPCLKHQPLLALGFSYTFSRKIGCPRTFNRQQRVRPKHSRLKERRGERERKKGLGGGRPAMPDNFPQSQTLRAKEQSKRFETNGEELHLLAKRFSLVGRILRQTFHQISGVTTIYFLSQLASP